MAKVIPSTQYICRACGKEHTKSFESYTFPREIGDPCDECGESKMSLKTYADTLHVKTEYRYSCRACGLEKTWLMTQAEAFVLHENKQDPCECGEYRFKHVPRGFPAVTQRSGLRQSGDFRDKLKGLNKVYGTNMNEEGPDI